ncbi:MAG TPA: hypothetical protein VIO94_07265 [Phenylobacterium sp.]
MHRCVWWTAGLAALAAAGTAWAAETFRLHSEGYGPVRVGMSVGQAQTALGGKLAPSDDSGPADGCWHLKAASGHEGVTFMIQDGRVTRASLYGEPSAVKTVSGAGLGDTEAAVRALYGDKLKSEPHAYGDAGDRYLTYWARPHRGVRFEIVGGKVAAIHAGEDSIGYIEGCS